MMHFSKQFRGYNKSQVDVLLDEKENQIRLLNERIKKLQDDYDQLKKQKDLLLPQSVGSGFEQS